MTSTQSSRDNSFSTLLNTERATQPRRSTNSDWLSSPRSTPPSPSTTLRMDHSSLATTSSLTGPRLSTRSFLDSRREETTKSRDLTSPFSTLRTLQLQSTGEKEELLTLSRTKDSVDHAGPSLPPLLLRELTICRPTNS